MSHWSKEQALAYDQQWGELAFHRQIPSLAGVSDNDNIVEIGCGGGFLSVCLTTYAQGASVLALDPSAKMIELANKRKQQTGLSDAQLKFLQAGAESLNVQAESIDLVVAAFSLHHWSDAELGMQLVFNSLKSEGKIWLCEDMNTPTGGALKVNDNLKAFAGIKQLLKQFAFSNIEKRLLATPEGEFLIVQATKAT
ncbi:class I SAM-dependent methyltransferase [Pseudoalteromonas sp. JBTF-M23]|uniref:Class I SAM-dependent methyltransferase n=1 Tax=Pseudoalteromonas caenipelagi TaxID=2726988 RepID=A0A849VAB1_9GAMM|nr:class I SAM-dependent methyltransferase [Pseudoalteromonas caenipelagi]NOU49875.1 class I SAM-dependent methyltransferase [Pseudoalteromonas caenipelagi]